MVFSNKIVDLFNKIVDLFDKFVAFSNKIVDLFGKIVDLLFERGVLPHLENPPGYRPVLHVTSNLDQHFN